MESRLRASHEQFGILLEYMESHNDLARPRQGAQGRLRSDRVWQDLTQRLNSVGGGVQKTTEKWKKVWADWKTKTKKKALLIRREVAGTGGGPSSRQTLTPLEERVLSIIGLSAIVGQQAIEEQGFELELLPEASQQLLQLPVDAPISPLPTPVTDVIDAGPSHRALEFERPPLPATVPPPSSQQSTPHRTQTHSGRVRQMTPFDRAAREFVRIEDRRLQLEESRDRRLHEREVEREKLFHQREMERLNIESRRLEVDHTHNRLLQQLADIAQSAMSELLPRLQPPTNP